MDEQRCSVDGMKRRGAKASAFSRNGQKTRIVANLAGGCHEQILKLSWTWFSINLSFLFRLICIGLLTSHQRSAVFARRLRDGSHLVQSVDSQP